MHFTPANERPLDAQDNDSLEQRGLYTPLGNIDGITFIGWESSLEPIFKLDESADAETVAIRISNMAQDGELQSSGLRAYIVTALPDKNLAQNAVVIVKIENWWDNCLPREYIGDYDRIDDYIEQREQEMSDELLSYFMTPTIEVDTHSVFGGDYGQYQFVGWE